MNIAAGTKDSASIMPAVRILREKGIDVDVYCIDSEEMDLNEQTFVSTMRRLRDIDFVVIRFHNDPSYFKKFERFLEALYQNKRPAFIDTNVPGIMKQYRNLFPFDEKSYDTLTSFVELGGDENQMGLILWVCKNIKGIDVMVPAPKKPKMEGIYHPDRPVGIELENFLDSLDTSRPTIGILFHQHLLLNNNLEGIDELVRTIEKNGSNTIPVFFASSAPNNITGAIGIRAICEQFLSHDGIARVDAVIMNSGFSQISLSNPGDGDVKAIVYNFFMDLGVPVLQTMNLWGAQEEWETGTTGLSSIEISTNVVWPEFDGQIITVPITSTKIMDDGRRLLQPIPDRVERVAAMARAWADLRRTPISERRVAILLYQNPPTNDRIGSAAGLDTCLSTIALLKAMKERGYGIDSIPSKGNELIKLFIEGVTNDTEWQSPDQIHDRAADLIAPEVYCRWFEATTENVQKAICRNWGSPPGDLYVINGSMVIQGIKDGNVFIGLQPSRGLLEQVETLYHDPDVVMPHHYVGYYRWIKDVFKAQAVIHMGCHGTLEWLPGKGVGLSKDCYPDVVLEDMPNIYPYIMENPGEGIQAKRRSDAVIIDHMVPAMTRAESYEELMELDADLQSYFHSVNAGQMEKVSVIAEKIHGTVTKLSLFKELGLQEGASSEELKVKLENLYDYVTEIKDALIKDGLHVLGKVPEGKRLTEMVYCLVRLRNGAIPSMREAICTLYGFALDDLQNNPSEWLAGMGMTKGAMLDEIDRQFRVLIEDMQAVSFNRERSRATAIARYGEGKGALMTVVDYVCDILVPNIIRTREEIDNLLVGLDGGYVPPGPSGPPTRGNAHLLPTGRNFYSIDPDAIPSPVCWKMGRIMADQMIERHIKEKGCYPKSVGIVIWATDTMKTGRRHRIYPLADGAEAKMGRVRWEGRRPGGDASG